MSSSVQESQLGDCRNQAIAQPDRAKTTHADFPSGPTKSITGHNVEQRTLLHSAAKAPRPCCSVVPSSRTQRRFLEANCLIGMVLFRSAWPLHLQDDPYLILAEVALLLVTLNNLP